MTLALVTVFTALALASETQAPETSFEPEAVISISEVDEHLLGDNGDFLGGTAPRCLVNDFSVPGQGVHASGAVGGMTFTPYAPPINPEALSTMASPETTYTLADLSAHAAHTVAILVADEFNGIYTIPEAYFITAGSTLQDVTDLWQQHPEISHGALVLNHLNALLHGTGHYTLESYYDSTDDSTRRFTWRNDDTNRELIVSAVDLASGGYIKTDDITFTIRDAIVDLYQDHQPDKMVVNMSWVLLPCGVVQDFNSVKSEVIPHFQAYLKALAAHNDTLGGLTIEAIEAQLRLLARWVPDNDPLHLLVMRDERFELPHPDFGLVFVASSGNYGRKLNYPMFPAAWEFVTSVSAPNGPPPFANPGGVGGVERRGAWFRLTDPIGLNANPQLSTPQEPYPVGSLSYAGTSFSAPMVSLEMALMP